MQRRVPPLSPDSARVPGSEVRAGRSWVQQEPRRLGEQTRLSAYLPFRLAYSPLKPPTQTKKSYFFLTQQCRPRVAISGSPKPRSSVLYDPIASPTWMPKSCRTKSPLAHSASHLHPTLWFPHQPLVWPRFPCQGFRRPTSRPTAPGLHPK